MKKVSFLIITVFSAQLSSASYARRNNFNPPLRSPARSIGSTTHKPTFPNKKQASPARSIGSTTHQRDSSDPSVAGPIETHVPGTARKVADDIRAVGAESFEGGGAAPAVVVAGKSLI